MPGKGPAFLRGGIGCLVVWILGGVIAALAGGNWYIKLELALPATAAGWIVGIIVVFACGGALGLIASLVAPSYYEKGRSDAYVALTRGQGHLPAPDVSPFGCVPDAIAEIASILREGFRTSEAAEIETLRKLADSSDPSSRERFRAEITTNPRYWRTEGGIASVTMSNAELNRRFRRAYYDLAVACDRERLDSEYSRDVKAAYGEPEA